MRKREILRAERIRMMSCPRAITNIGTLPELFNARYVPVTESGCWIWIGEVAAHGYGLLGFDGHREYAHRVSHRLFKGEIPDGLTIDHLCRVRCCVNPDHLEAVTRGENVLRGESTSARFKRATHCIRGHELAGDNLMPLSSRPNTRVCRACSRLRGSAGYAMSKMQRASH